MSARCIHEYVAWDTASTIKGNTIASVLKDIWRCPEEVSIIENNNDLLSLNLT